VRDLRIGPDPAHCEAYTAAVQRVLIIGATSAIATEVARRHAKRGDRLFLIARDVSKLDVLASELDAAVAGTLAGDLDETRSNQGRIDAAIDTLGRVDVAVIAHGLLGDQRETEESWDAAEAVLTTNLLSVVSLLIPLANHMQAEGSGSLGVMSSVAGERGRPRNYTYGAAKGALTTYLEGVRSRLVPHGVRVHTLKLGPVDTPMTATHQKNALFSTAARVADDIVACMDGPGGAFFVPWYWAPIMSVVRGLPEPIFQRIGALSGR
jgi:short-subunit dehydrogenase